MRECKTYCDTEANIMLTNTATYRLIENNKTNRGKKLLLKKKSA